MYDLCVGSHITYLQTRGSSLGEGGQFLWPINNNFIWGEGGKNHSAKSQEWNCACYVKIKDDLMGTD